MLIASFDIFDTCLVRICGDELTLIEVLAKTILAESVSRNEIIEFQRIRIQGEFTARNINKSEEISTIEIYKNCDFSSLTHIPNDEILIIEYSLQVKMLSPVKMMLKTVEKYRSLGYKILFISDMHLPQNLLSDVLNFHGFYDPTIDDIFVSSEYKLTKQSGLLFEYIRSIYSKNQKIKKWIHLGDNYNSDFKIPRKYKIKSKLINHKGLYYSSKAYKIKLNYLDSSYSILSSISKSISLQNDTDSRNFIIDLICPLFIPYVFHILNDASKRKINDLYFFARDSYVLFEIAKVFQQQFPNIKLHYLYVSRRTLYLPSIKTVTYKDFIHLKKMKGLSIGDYLDQFGLDFNELEINSELGDEELKLKSVFENFENIKFIEKKKNEQTKLLLEYLIQEEFANKKNNVAMVDLTGSRSSQQSLNSILKEFGFYEIFSYYLLTSEDRKSYSEAGSFDAVILPDKMKDSPFKYFGDLVLLLENYYSITNQNRTISYSRNEKEVIPVFDNINIPIFKEEYMNVNISTLKQYACYYIESYCFDRNEDNLFLGVYMNSVFAMNPLHKYVKLFRGFEVSENLSNSKSILSSFYLKSNESIVWLRGSLTNISPLINYFITIFYYFKR